MTKSWKIIGCLLVAAAVLTAAGCGVKPGSSASLNGSGSENENSQSGKPAQNADGGNTVNAGSAGQTTNTDSPNNTNGSDSSSDSNSSSNSDSSEKAQEKKEINVYVTNDDQTELIKTHAEISYTDENDKILAALKALQQDGPNGGISLWKKAEFKSAEVKDGAVSVNLHLPDEARLGSEGEDLALTAIEKTVFQFEEIKTLDILVDGEAVDSLMGHDELDHPIKREDAESAD